MEQQEEKFLIAGFMRESVFILWKKITKILSDNQNKLNLSEKQKERWHKKCLCLVEFENVEEITPLEFEHQSNMDDWLILEKIEDVVAGISVQYDYQKSRF